jgi:hypothetical protein
MYESPRLKVAYVIRPYGSFDRGQFVINRNGTLEHPPQGGGDCSRPGPPRTAVKRHSAVMPMIIHDKLAATETPSRSFISESIGSLRSQRDAGGSGGFWMMSGTARVRRRRPEEAAADPGGNQAELLTLRADMDRLLAEVERLSKLVAASRAEDEFEQNRPARSVISVLWRAAARANERASDRVEKAASHLLRTASDRAREKGEWDRTDRAVADLLSALTEHANSESKRLQDERAAANRLRLARQLVLAERELTAIRQFRARSWWRWAFSCW